eukprot:CAMPEP_0181369610 /NCGR_PEP_ID=MMETSP1106-20121128/12894_1 /TAXON_ID=81844 /ORGANISM="Mantoniella antarctica, Strain SL-175" /LENGTH=143 /DNA_ID=CAMNT_0023486167 /DNA_START=328 /DNA_END=758 /DNA_ORIENTATION=-
MERNSIPPSTSVFWYMDHLSLSKYSVLESSTRFWPSPVEYPMVLWSRTVAAAQGGPHARNAATSARTAAFLLIVEAVITVSAAVGGVGARVPRRLCALSARMEEGTTEEVSSVRTTCFLIFTRAATRAPCGDEASSGSEAVAL